MTELSGDGDARRRKVDFALPSFELRLDSAGHRDTLKLFEEVDVKEGPPKLSVGDAAQADGLLSSDHVPDVRIFDRAQLLAGDFAVSVPPARVEQRLRPQQTADVIGAEWRIELCRVFHGGILQRLLETEGTEVRNGGTETSREDLSSQFVSVTLFLRVKPLPPSPPVPLPPSRPFPVPRRSRI